MVSRPRALVLHARGTNRDSDMSRALEIAGAEPEIVPLTVLRERDADWTRYQLLAVPGGFSHGDALGAGRLLGLELSGYFSDQVHALADGGVPVIGVCNGFQALVKAGILPGDGAPATLTHNARGRFECRWVELLPSGDSFWTSELAEPIRCPVAHGEGRFVTNAEEASRLYATGRVAFVYADDKGEAAGGAYPANPNGSVDDIAGVVGPGGNVIGLMPHPEDHVLDVQDLSHGRRPRPGNCLPLFRNGVEHAAQL